MNHRGQNSQFLEKYFAPYGAWASVVSNSGQAPPIPTIFLAYGLLVMMVISSTIVGEIALCCTAPCLKGTKTPAVGRKYIRDGQRPSRMNQNENLSPVRGDIVLCWVLYCVKGPEQLSLKIRTSLLKNILLNSSMHFFQVFETCSLS